MKVMIGKCNNTDCLLNEEEVCILVSESGHVFQYDHDTGLISCQVFANQQARRKK